MSHLVFRRRHLSQLNFTAAAVMPIVVSSSLARLCKVPLVTRRKGRSLGIRNACGTGCQPRRQPTCRRQTSEFECQDPYPRSANAEGRNGLLPSFLRPFFLPAYQLKVFHVLYGSSEKVRKEFPCPESVLSSSCNGIKSIPGTGQSRTPVTWQPTRSWKAVAFLISIFMFKAYISSHCVCTLLTSSAPFFRSHYFSS